VLAPLVLRKVRLGLGGRLRLCVSGGGALPRHVDETLLGIGLPLRNGYGLTETSPVASVRLPHQQEPLATSARRCRTRDRSATPDGQSRRAQSARPACCGSAARR
jgi:acyl-CoA synthetase (AMP-forming)/AMP-acid ligase II